MTKDNRPKGKVSSDESSKQRQPSRQENVRIGNFYLAPKLHKTLPLSYRIRAKRQQPRHVSQAAAALPRTSGLPPMVRGISALLISCGSCLPPLPRVALHFGAIVASGKVQSRAKLDYSKTGIEGWPARAQVSRVFFMIISIFFRTNIQMCSDSLTYSLTGLQHWKWEQQRYSIFFFPFAFPDAHPTWYLSSSFIVPTIRLPPPLYIFP